MMRPRDPRRGYVFAVLAMAASGVAIYVNSLGVRTFSDSTLYTALKNSVTGLALLVPFGWSSNARSSLKRLTARELLLLVLVAVIGGSLSYALYFRGLQLTTPVTASVIDHTQFLVVAGLAAVFLGERFSAAIWAALLVLLIGLTIGIAAGAVRWDTGVILVSAATLLWAVDFVIMKLLLGSVPPLIVMMFKMSAGSVLLMLWVAASGRLGLVAALTPLQWEFVAVTGILLLAFTLTSVLGLRDASATAVTAIPAGSPILTTALVLVSRTAEIPPSRWLGLALAFAAVIVVFTLGRRAEVRAAQQAREGRR
ncbi:MAG TPA: DMT family transporter [Spirochaetia bacterium]|nr:DMT family transporter [Spirochaetia bacterium]